MSHNHTRIPLKISRRAALAGPLAMIAAPAVSCAQDPHVAWLSEWRELRDAFNGVTVASAEESALWVRYTAIENRIARTPARTDTGLIAQLEWLYEDGHSEFSCDHHRRILACVLSQMKGGA